MWRALRILLILKPGGFSRTTVRAPSPIHLRYSDAREGITKINLFFKRMRILAKNSTVDQAQNRAGRSPNRFTITVATAFRLWKRRLYLVEISAG